MAASSSRNSVDRIRHALRTWLDPHEPYLLPAFLLLATRIYQAFAIPNGAEDAYITFRYAMNWAHGVGPVYNLGEHVLGCTSPLWMSWCALGVLLTGDPLVWTRVTSIAFDLMTLVLAIRILSRQASPLSAWVWGVFFAVFPLFSAYAVLGMETSLLLLLVVASAAAVDARRAWAGILLGLLALTRPEGAFAALLIAIGASWRARAIGLGIVAAGMAVLTFYYGSPIPQSLLAKAGTYGLAGPRSGLAWISGFVPVFFGRPVLTLDAQQIFPFAIVGTAAAAIALPTLVRQRRAGLYIVVPGLAVLVIYLLLGVPYFSWYLVLPLAAWAWAAAAGLPVLSRRRELYVLLALYLVSDSFFLGGLYRQRQEVEATMFGRAAEALAAASGGEGTVFLEPIGVIGYLCPLRVIDEVGLVSPEVARRRTRGPGWYTDIVREQHPEFLVVRLSSLERNEAFAGTGAPFRSFEERAEILSEYADVTPGEDASNSDLRIMKRR